MLTGKGIYLWQIRHTLGGDPEKIAEAVSDAGMSHVWMKVADGPGRYNIDPQGKDLVPELIEELGKRGIACWGWQYVYGRYPELEAQRAVQRINELDLDGFVVNAEGEYKSAGADNARTYMRELRRGAPNLLIGLSSYRFPRLHATFPFDAFLEYCDFNAPQVYWMGAHNSADQLRACIQEYAQYAGTFPRPVFPTGAAYSEYGWRPSVAEVVAFMDATRDLKLSGFNFWEMRNCLINMPEVWQAISDWSGFQIPTPDPGDPATPEPTGLMGQVLTDYVNIRTGPSTGFGDVGDLLHGEEKEILDVAGSDAWVKINSDPERWVAAEHRGTRYLRITRKD